MSNQLGESTCFALSDNRRRGNGSAHAPRAPFLGLSRARDDSAALVFRVSTCETSCRHLRHGRQRRPSAVPLKHSPKTRGINVFFPLCIFLLVEGQKCHCEDRSYFARPSSNGRSRFGGRRDVNASAKRFVKF